MRAAPLLLALTLAGCRSAPPSRPLLVTHLNTMGQADADRLVTGTYPMPPDSLLVVDLTRRSLFLRELHDREMTVEMATLRNPGAYVYVVHGPPHRYLTAAERKAMEDLARSFGATVVARVPVRYGPDGRTPKVMRPVGRWSPEVAARPTPTDVHLWFPTLGAAKEAARYVDADYRVTTGKEVKGAWLEASIRVPNGAVLEEESTFAPLARRFGGKVAWIGTASR